MEKITIERNAGEKDAIRSSITLKRDGNKEMRIHFEGNLDLYFTLSNFDNDSTFYIGIDNYELYKIFATLYDDVMNANFRKDEYFDIFDDEDERDRLRRDEDNRKRAIEDAKDMGLIDGDTIKLLSDDYPEDVAPYLRIERLKNAFKLTFLINIPERIVYGDERDVLSDYKDGLVSIRICNDGSKYQMFSTLFMKAYNSLLEMDLENPQIHIEEYLLDKRLSEGESLEHILKLKK